MTELPPFRPKKKCPQCRFHLTSTKYWSGGHKDCPVFGRDWDHLLELSRLATAFGGAGQDFIRDAEAIQAEWRPHLDRTCLRCGYSWSEATV